MCVSVCFKEPSSLHVHACKVTSVVSNSLCPHGLQPTRLLCPWDSSGKNTGVGCHFLLHTALVVNPKGNQPRVFTGRTEAKTETPALWPHDAKSRLIGKDPDAGKDQVRRGRGRYE